MKTSTICVIANNFHNKRKDNRTKTIGQRKPPPNRRDFPNDEKSYTVLIRPDAERRWVLLF